MVVPLAASAAALAVAVTEVEYSVMVLFVVCDLPVRVGCDVVTELALFFAIGNKFCKWQQNPTFGNIFQNLATNSASGCAMDCH